MIDGSRRRSVQLVAVAVLMFALLAPAAAGAGEGRTGAWVDEVIFIEEANLHSALTRLAVGDVDLYLMMVSDPELFRTVEANPDLDYKLAYGTHDSLIFNPAGPVFRGTGKLNPFAVKEIREAVNWLVDRNYIVDEIYRGLARPRFTPLHSITPDYARLADVVRAMELKYAPDFQRAAAVIAAEMEKLGAGKVNGVWHYGGEPVRIIVLIRIEDERRREGDYVASLLEDVGFAVERQYVTAAEVGVRVFGSDPHAGLFHVYTHREIMNYIVRDAGVYFDFHFTPRGNAVPLWQAYEPEPRFDEVAGRLARSDFSTLEERTALMAEALELALKDSARVYLVDQVSFTPYRAELDTASDLTTGAAPLFVWPHALRFKEMAGGRVNVAVPGLFVGAWNPIGGTNYQVDIQIVSAVSDNPLVLNPFTGLPMPHRIERAEVVVEEGLPVINSSSWVELSFAPEIQVPGDAWVDWDPVEQRFITVAERYPQGLTARSKSVVYYPGDLFSTVRWHDGSPLSPADVVLAMILTFDRGYEESPVFDPTAKFTLEALKQAFKGVRIRSVDPLVIETYGDDIALDAEMNVVPWFPTYTAGPAAWHTVGLGIRAEAGGELAFTSYKADVLGVEWANFVAGPSLAVLARHLEEARASGYVPYEPTLGRFLTEDEVRARWSNLARWYGEKGHFLVGTGPLYLERVHPVEKIAQLKRNPDYPDSAGRWDRFSDPMIPGVEVLGSLRVVAGAAASFDVEVTFAGEPYPAGDIGEVKFLVAGARGEVVLSGSAEEAGEGLYRIVLDGDQTAKLSAGPNRLEVIVVSETVSIPSFRSFEFVSTR